MLFSSGGHLLLETVLVCFRIKSLLSERNGMQKRYSILDGKNYVFFNNLGLQGVVTTLISQ